MNSAQACFVMGELDSLKRENTGDDGYFRPPTPEQRRDLLTRAEAYDRPWVRLWHRLRPVWRRGTGHMT